MNGNLAGFWSEEDSKSYERKSLYKRLHGRLYTPDLIADPLIEKLSKRPQIFQNISIIDQLIGNGRLMAKFREHYEFEFSACGEIAIYLWDRDQRAPRGAAKKLKSLCGTCGISANAKFIFCSPFRFTLDAFEGFGVCICNTTWEAPKPHPVCKCVATVREL